MVPISHSLPSHHDSKSLLEKISALEEAVSSLQQQQQQQQQQGARSHSHSQPTPPRHASDSAQTRQGPQGVNDHRAALPEGDSSFGSQALHASQIAELTSSEASQSPIVMLELAKLRDMAQDQTAPRSVRHHYLSGLRREGPKSDMELPPSDFVVQVLRVLREMKGTFWLPLLMMIRSPEARDRVLAVYILRHQRMHAG